mmetsp:Transcript_10553/g.27123  ORF Transcript_10553/g.27123 Transcript_10553/m.27123 type:complete len:299 (-) Transcript_10553:383-1279(-)
MHDHVQRVPRGPAIRAHKGPGLRCGEIPPLRVDHHKVGSRRCVDNHLHRLAAVVRLPRPVLPALGVQEVVAVLWVHRGVGAVDREPGECARGPTRVDVALRGRRERKRGANVAHPGIRPERRDVVLVRVPRHRRGGGVGGRRVDRSLARREVVKLAQRRDTRVARRCRLTVPPDRRLPREEIPRGVRLVVGPNRPAPCGCGRRINLGVVEVTAPPPSDAGDDFGDPGGLNNAQVGVGGDAARRSNLLPHPTRQRLRQNPVARVGQHVLYSGDRAHTEAHYVAKPLRFVAKCPTVSAVE